MHSKYHDFSLGTVVTVMDSGKAVVINRGLRDGVGQGDAFLIFGIGPNITDPETGEDLGQLELVRGRGKVAHVQERMATIVSTEVKVGEITKRVVEPSRMSGGLGSLFRPDSETIEERKPPAIVPFRGVKEGDKAKPV
ncbi:hypothetical protein [Mesorhizobium sp. M0185]|uniref:hypothetical protein n=1 Tax=unclassified Mesorhizobium TaxID=325217 RepID=UPI003339DC7F